MILHSTATAIAFLHHFDPTGFHNLVAIDPEWKEGIVARTFGASEYDAMANFIEQYQGKRNIYFHVNEPYPDAPNAKLKKHQIAKVRAIALDVDPAKDKPLEQERERLEALATSLSLHMCCAPTLITDSGNGYQFFWVLKEKLDATQATPWAEAQGNALAMRYEGDSTFDVNRVMRLPGTINLPNKKKVGRVPALARIFYQSDDRYTDSTLSNWVPPVAPLYKNTETVSVDINAIESMTVVDDLPEATRAKLDALLAANPDFKALFEGDASVLPNSDVSASAFLWHLAYHLKREGRFTATEFGQVAWTWRPADLTNKEDPIRQIERAWARNDAEAAIEQFEIVDINPRAQERKLYAVSAFSGLGLLTGTATPYLVKGLLDASAMSVMYGDSNSGKTFIAVDLSYHIATGLPYQNRKAEKGLVVYVAAEGGRGMWKRLAAINTMRTIPSDLPFAIVPCPIDLLSEKGSTKELCKLIKEQEALFNQPARLIVIDTLSRAIAGGDENSSTDMGALVKHLDTIRFTTGAHLLIVHHSGKDKARGARGHSLLRAATDTEIEIADNTVAIRKQRDLEPIPDFGFTLKTVTLGHDQDGDPITSCTVEYGLARKAKIAGDFDDLDNFGRLPLQGLEIIYMQAACLLTGREMTEQGDIGPADGTSEPYFMYDDLRPAMRRIANEETDPLAAFTIKTAADAPDRTFFRTVKTLVDKGWLTKPGRRGAYTINA